MSGEERGLGVGTLGGRTLRIAFAGAGAISGYHLAGWRETPNVEVVAICDPAREKAEARAREFGIGRVYVDFAEMLDAERPDAVEIATPVGSHAGLVRLAAERGVHVSCQKPVTATVAEAEALIRDVGDRVRFMVHENFRFRPHYQQARQWIEQDRVGAVRHARLVVRASGMLPHEGGSPLIVRRQPYLQGFKRCLIFEVLIHHLDVLRFLLGPLSVVSALIARVSPAIAGEDLAVVLLRGNHGLTCVLDGSLSAPGYPWLPVDRLEIMGSAGTLVFDTDRLSLVGTNEPPVVHDLPRNYQACFTNAIRHFVRCLRTGAPFETDRLDNLETLKLMEASYVAAGVSW